MRQTTTGIASLLGQGTLPQIKKNWGRKPLPQTDSMKVASRQFLRFREISRRRMKFPMADKAEAT